VNKSADEASPLAGDANEQESCTRPTVHLRPSIRPPANETCGHQWCWASSTLMITSITPIKIEAPWMSVTAYSQPMNGLCATPGLDPQRFFLGELAQATAKQEQDQPVAQDNG
jgi:hypothetical protein